MRFPKIGAKINAKVKNISMKMNGVGGVVQAPTMVMPKINPMVMHPSEIMHEPDVERRLHAFKNLQRYLKGSS